jgi:Zn-dependent protease with chaperone function
MKNSLKTFLLIAAIPAIALAVSLGGIAKMDADLRASFAEQFKDVSKTAIAKVTVREFLANVDDPSLGSLRRDVGLLDAMKYASLATIAFSFAYIGLIRLFGALSRKSRAALLRLFRPAYLGTSALLAGVTIVNAGLLIGAIYFGESLLIERVHVKLIFLIGAGALLGCGAVIKSLAESFRKDAMDLDGELVGEASEIRALVSSVSEEIGAAKIDHIVAGNAMTFFATEAPVRVAGAKLGGKTIYLSRPLSEFLSVGELKSIVTHELGHFKGMDTEYSMKFYPIYRGLGLSIQRLAERSSGAMALALVPTRVMFNFLLESFALSESEHSRERELAADGEAVRASDPRTFSSALLKTSALLELWGSSVEKAREAPPEAGDEEVLALREFREASKSFTGRDYERMLESEVFHPFDSHPPIKERILAVGQDPATVSAHIDFAPAVKASTLF